MSKHANTEDSAVLVVLVAAGMCVQGNSFLVAHTRLERKKVTD
jgi:hypothetical protein